MGKFDTANKQFTYGIKFQVDDAALNNVKQEIQEIQRLTLNDMKIKLNTDNVGEFYKEVKAQATQLQTVLESSFNSNLGVFNVQKLNENLNKIDLKKVRTNFAQLGATGVNALNSISTSLVTQNTTLKQSSEWLEKITTTFKNTARFGIASSVFNNISNSIQKAYDYTVKLDTSLNDIRIVTDKSAEDMESFALSANKAAQSLGKSTRDYTEASLIYYQQGLSDEETAARTETTLKAANVTGQSTSEVSEQLTAVWNGYKVSAEEAELYVDKLAAVANTTASDLEELSTGMAKVASAASTMGVDIDQLNAQLATIVSVTRQAPESVGTSLKTIYARLGDIKAGVDEETTLGSYTSKMESLGISVLDANNNLRDTGEIIEEVGDKWEDLSREQQVYLAKTMGGTYQYNALLSLFDNWDMYNEALETSENAAGTLQKNQDIYMESTAAHLEQLTTASERLYNSLVDQDSVKGVADALTDVVNLLAEFTESIGGGIGLLNMLGTTAMKVFSTQIGRELVTLNANIKKAFEDTQNVKFSQDIADKFSGVIDNDISQWQKDYSQYSRLLNEEQRTAYEQMINQNVELKNQLNLWKERTEYADTYVEALMEVQKTSKTLTDEEKQERESWSQDNLKISTLPKGGSTEEIDNVIEVSQKSGEQLFNSNLSDTFDSFRSGIKTLEEVNQEINDIYNNLSNIPEAIAGTELDTNGLQEYLATIKEKIAVFVKQSGDQIDNIKLDDYIDKIFPLDKITAKIKKAGHEVIKVTEEVFETENKQINGVGEEVQRKADASSNSLRGVEEQFKKIDYTATIIKMAGAFGQLATAISIIPNWFEIWSSEGLSTGEKVIQTITSLTTVVTMLVSAVKSLKEANIGQVLSSIGTSLTSSGGSFSTLITSLGGGLQKIIPSLGKASAAAAKTATTATAAAEGTAALGASTATAAEGTAALGVSAGAGAAALGIFAIAIVAVGAAIYGIVKAYNADADAAKKAREQAEATKEQYQDIKSSYEELTNSISDYADSVNALKQLEKGTLEWKQAVLELNEEILTLIEKYPELAASIQNEDGILSISANGINELLEKQFSQVQNAYRSSNANETRALEAELKSAKTDFRRSITYSVPSQQQQQLEKNYQKFGVDNSQVSQTNQDQFNRLQAQQSQIKGMTSDEVNTLVNALEKDGLSILENVDTLKTATGFNDQLAQAVWDNKDAVKELNSTINETNAQIASLDIASAQSYLTENSEAYNQLGSEDQSKVARAFAQSTKDEREKVDKQGDYSGKWGSKDDKTIQQEYADLMGYTWVKNGWGTGTYKNSNDEEVKVDDDVAREALANNEALENANKSTTKYIEAINNFTSVANSAADAANLTGTEAKNTSSLLKSGFQSEDKQFDFSTATDDQLSALKSIRDNEEQWKDISSKYKEAGYSSAKEFTAAFDEEYDQWSSSEKSAERASNLRDKTNAEFLAAVQDDAEALDISENALISYTEHLMDTNEALKDDKLLAEEVAVAAYEFADGVDALADALDSNEQLLEDWKNGLTDSTDAYEAIGEVQDAVEQMFGIRVSEDFVKDHLEDLKNLANGDVSALEELQVAASQDYVANLTINADDTRAQEIKSQLDDWIDKYANKEMKVGASIDDTAFIEALNNMISTGEMTSEQVQSYLNSMGYEPEFEEVEADTPNQVATSTTTVSASIFGKDIGDVAVLDTTTEMDGVTAKMFGISNAKDSSKGKITSIKRTSNTSTKANAVKNSGKSGQKVGSSSGSGSNSDPDKIDALDDEFDRYHKINTQIEKISNSLDLVQSQQEKFVGSELLDNLNEQWDLLNTQIENYNEKLKIAQDEQAELQAKLAAKGVTFNADGTVSNYMQALQAQEDYVNSLINNYNNMSKEQQESYKDTVEAAKEEYETFKDNIDRYDELISDFIPSLQQEIQDAIDEQIEINIEKFNKEIEITLDMDQATRDWNEWVKKVIDGIDDEDILGNAEARLKDFYTYLNEGATADIQVGTRHLEDLLNELYKMDAGEDNVYGDNRSQALEDLETYYTQLMESLEDLVDLQDELHQDVLDEMDEVQDKFDEQVEAYEYVTDLIEHDMKLIELTLGDEAYGKLADFYEAQNQNYQSQLDFQRQQKDFWYAQMQAAEEGSEEWDSAREKWEDAVDEFNSILEDGLQNALDKFENAINEIFQTLNNQVTSGKGLDYLESEWDLINENADKYLDNMNAAYGIQELQSKYLESINDNDGNLKTQQKLKKLMDSELASLKEKDRLTQYDLDRATKIYELELAKIALQEAQQNKSTMRLRRDSQGNYTYQYVADSDAVDEAQDEVNNLYNELYNFDKDRYNETLQSIYDTWVDYQDAMAEAALINDPQLRAEREELIQKEYNELMTQNEADYQTAKLNLRESALEDWVNINDMELEDFQNLTDDEVEIIMTELVPTWNNGLSEMAEKFAGEGGFAEATTDAWYEIQEAQKEYMEDTQELEEISGQTFDSIINGESEAATQAKELISDNKELIDAYGDELAAVQSVYEQVKKLREEYEAAEAAAKAATKAAYEYQQQELARQAAAAKNQTQTTSSAGSSSSSSSSSGSSGSSGGTAAGSGNGTPEVGDTVTYTGGKYYSSSYGASPSGSRGVGGQVKITAIRSGRPYPIHVTSSNSAYGWLKQDQISGYDTGGYTGDWDSTGKLGVLHQKELVLNAKDTENMLNTVAIMRSLAYNLGSSALAKLAGVSASNYTGDIGSNALEQDVHIEANFPNVHNSAEIEQALNNLVNAASQKAWEK